MARLPRLCLPGIPQHIIQRGNNHQACFASDEDFAAYAHWLDEYAHKYKVAIHAWVFMTNHVHLLATPDTEDGISRLMQTLGRHYVRYFNYCGAQKSHPPLTDQIHLLMAPWMSVNSLRNGKE